MSATGTSGPYPKPNQPRPDPDRKAQPLRVDVTNTTNGRTPIDDRKAQTAEPRRSFNGASACPPGTENLNGAEPGTSGSGPARVKRKPQDLELDWLPPDWTFEDRVRTSGVTAGSTDRVSFDCFDCHYN